MTPAGVDGNVALNLRAGAAGKFAPAIEHGSRDGVCLGSMCPRRLYALLGDGLRGVLASEAATEKKSAANKVDAIFMRAPACAAPWQAGGSAGNERRGGARGVTRMKSNHIARREMARAQRTIPGRRRSTLRANRPGREPWTAWIRREPPTPSVRDGPLLHCEAHVGERPNAPLRSAGCASLQGWTSASVHAAF